MSTQGGEQYVDVAVVGASVAGVLTAIQAKKLGLSVALLDYIYDTGYVESIIEIPRTFLNAHSISGEAFAGLVRTQITRRGIAEQISLSEHTDEIHIDMGHGGPLRANRIVFSPFGRETGLPSIPAASNFLGIGVSMDALSDAPFSSGLPVGVFGCGKRAAEQALLAAGAGTIPTIYCAEAHFDPAGLDQELHDAGIEVEERIEIRSLEAAPSGLLGRLLLINAHGDQLERDASALFLAQGLTCDWSIFDRPVDEFNCGQIIMAGVAHGLPYWDYLAQILDVQRVVDAINRK